MTTLILALDLVSSYPSRWKLSPTPPENGRSGARLIINHNVVDAVNVVMFYLEIISSATSEFLPGDITDLLNWIELNSRMRRGDYSGSSHTRGLKIGTPVATLPSTWHCRPSVGTGQSSVSTLRLGGIESLICNSYFSVTARTHV